MVQQQETVQTTAFRQQPAPTVEAAPVDVGAPPFIEVPRAAREKKYPS